jgi:hypothetical protein
VKITCTGRADPRHGDNHIRALQAEGNAATGLSFSCPGRTPTTGYAHADGGETYDFRCAKCRRHWKPSREDFARVVLVIAAVQGGWNAPVTVDISMIGRAI